MPCPTLPRLPPMPPPFPVTLAGEAAPQCFVRLAATSPHRSERALHFPAAPKGANDTFFSQVLTFVPQEALPTEASGCFALGLSFESYYRTPIAVSFHFHPPLLQFLWWCVAQQLLGLLSC